MTSAPNEAVEDLAEQVADAQCPETAQFVASLLSKPKVGDLIPRDLA